jgi:peroxiredoxin
MKKGVVLFLFLLSLKTFSQNISSIEIETIDGKPFSGLHPQVQPKATVIIFLLADCPACENYALTLNKMNAKYGGNGIEFYGVFPGNYSTKEELTEYKNTYKVSFPLLLDKEKKLVKALKARVAPQAVVLDVNSKVVYSGRIDDWMYAVGKKRTVIAHHELQDAIDAIVAGKDIAVKTSIPVGCLIE